MSLQQCSKCGEYHWGSHQCHRWYVHAEPEANEWPVSDWPVQRAETAEDAAKDYVRQIAYEGGMREGDSMKVIATRGAHADQKVFKLTPRLELVVDCEECEADTEAV